MYLSGLQCGFCAHVLSVHLRFKLVVICAIPLLCPDGDQIDNRLRLAYTTIYSASLVFDGVRARIP
nr:MAG TPA: hypothetical protein [Caudoviricetes sp.]